MGQGRCHDEVAPGYEHLKAWIANRGLDVAGPSMEEYLNDPSAGSPAEYLTEIMVPVHRRS